MMGMAADDDSAYESDLNDGRSCMNDSSEYESDLNDGRSWLNESVASDKVRGDDKDEEYESDLGDGRSAYDESESGDARYRGIVAKCDADKGYGFIDGSKIWIPLETGEFDGHSSVTEGTDVFFHVSDFEDSDEFVQVARGECAREDDNAPESHITFRLEYQLDRANWRAYELRVEYL